VRVTARLEAPCRPEVLFREVEDLSTYPEWLTIVPRAVAEAAGPGEPADPAHAWQVELRARIGRLARSKRLRMVRTTHDAPRTVRFERHELGGRATAPWVLEARVEGRGDESLLTSVLTMELFYGGSFGTAILERLLADEIERSKPRLLARVSGVPPTSGR
jgi:hypothetical protein